MNWFVKMREDVFGIIRSSYSIDSIVLIIFAVLLALPFSFVLVDGGFTFAPFLAFDDVLSKGGFGIPIAIVGIAGIGLIFLVRLIQKQINFAQALTVLSLVLIVWMVVVVLYGLLTQSDYILLVFFIQSIMPICILVALLTLPFSNATIKSVVFIIPVVGSGAIVLLLLVAGYFISQYAPIVAFNHLAEAFYGTKNIQPIIVATGMMVILWQFSLAKRDFSEKFLWVLFIIHASYNLIIWSRSGLLVSGILFGAWLCSELVRRKWTKRFLVEKSVMAVVMLGMVVISLTIGGLSVRPITHLYLGQENGNVVNKGVTQPAQPGQENGNVVNKDVAQPAQPGQENGNVVNKDVAQPAQPAQPAQENGIVVNKDVAQEGQPGQENGNVVNKDVAQGGQPGQERSNKIYKDLRFGEQRRKRLFIAGVKRIMSSPVVGDAFTPLARGTEVQGRVVQTQKIFPSHNQYLSIAIRAGVPALLLYLGVLFTMGTMLWRNFRNGSEIALVALFFFAGIMVSNNFQVYLMVSHSASVIYLIMAMSLRMNEVEA